MLFPLNVSAIFSFRKKTSYRIALAVLALYLVLVCVHHWGDVTPPRVTLLTPFSLVGPTTPLSLRIEDHGTGLRDITVRLVQNLEHYTLAQEQFASSSLLLGGGARDTFALTVVPFEGDTIPRRRGPATLVITARDHSWRALFDGNWTRMEQDVTVKFHPPRMETLSTPLSVTQGGAGLVVYQLSEDAVRHGIQIGEAFFPGYHLPDSAFDMFSLFAFPHHLPATTPIQLVADDSLGNHGTRRMATKVTPQQWRTRRLKISDRFIEQVIPPILAQTPDLDDLNDPLQNFLQVNNVLRAHNAEQLKALALDSRQAFLWNGPFLQLSKSAVEAAFADHRQYLYHGQVVDTQDHLGFDLAVTARYPVEAANDGDVVLATYFGIYGNTIVIDHGYGLQSLYAHLSSFNVTPGDAVVKGQPIGRSGMTGLAAGDHVHFSLLLHGVQINPLEWWDAQWVQSRMSQHLRKHDAVEPAALLPRPPTGFARRPPSRPIF